MYKRRFICFCQRFCFLRIVIGLVVLLTGLSTSNRARAEDWPTYMHDNQRSGVTSEALKLPLSKLWTYRSKHAPQPAWPDPAKYDIFHFTCIPLKPRVTFDRTFHVVMVGDAIYFASSANDKVHCLDAVTGKERWSFFTGGPVRLAPTIYEGKVYMGSDDGYVYCLDSADGKLIWKYKPSPIERDVIGNGRMISVWPIRTGVVVDNGAAYFCAGLFPSEGVYICALNANNGSELYRHQRFNVSPQGYLLASATRLYVPNGRTAPIVFDRKDGRFLRRYGWGWTGGTYALLTEDMLVTGPVTIGNIKGFGRDGGDRLATFHGNRLVVSQELSYLLADNELSAINRLKYSALARQRKNIVAARSRLRGKINKSRHGVIRNWWIIGPFDLGIREHGEGIPPGFEQAFPPEKEINLDKTYKGKGGKVHWQKVTGDMYGHLLFNYFLRPSNWNVAYALSYIYVPEERRNVTVLTGSGDGFKVWINDQEVFSKHIWRMSTPVTDSFSINLKQGWNKVLVKVEGSLGERWSIFFRIPDCQGMKCSTERNVDVPVQSGYDKEVKELALQLEDLDKQLEEKAREMQNCLVWKQPCQSLYSLILAGETLFAGGDNKVVAFHAISGKQLWTAEVKGKAYGLAVANGVLLVSTDKGGIYCFGEEAVSQPHFSFSPNNSSPYPEDKLTPVYSSAANLIVRESNIKKGYCLVFGCNEGRLAYELAKQTDLKIIGIEEDLEKVKMARKALDEAGVYGVRVTVHHGSLSELPYPSYFANLIVSDQMLVSGKVSGSADEIFRVLRPCGGMAYLGQTVKAAKYGHKLSQFSLNTWFQKSVVRPEIVIRKDSQWAVVHRNKLEGSGEWTCQYGNADNTTCSGDQLVQFPLGLSWFGRPGPERMLNRHCRPPAPLSTNGRLFIHGDNRIIAVDAYNGTELWDTEIRGLNRVNIPSDTGNMVANDDHIFVSVGGECWQLDAATGKVSFIYNVPQLSETLPHEWGYIAYADNLLFGSGVKKDSSYTSTRNLYEVWEYEVGVIKPCKLIISDYLFALRQDDGEKKWMYKGGVIINSTIAVSDNCLYFVESRSSAALENKKGRLGKEVLVDQYLVALDIRTGKKLWEHHFDFSKCSNVIYLCYADDTLIILGSSNKYYMYAFDTNDGSFLWSQEYNWLRIDHGGAIQHPVIIGDIIYAEPCVFNLKTGEKLPLKMPARYGCGIISASSTCLFYRDGTLGYMDLKTNKRYRWAGIRPGCLINVIPAGGILLTPEASSGCSCGYSLQTSFALIPIGKDRALLRVPESGK